MPERERPHKRERHKGRRHETRADLDRTEKLPRKIEKPEKSLLTRLYGLQQRMREAIKKGFKTISGEGQELGDIEAQLADAEAILSDAQTQEELAAAEEALKMGESAISKLELAEEDISAQAGQLQPEVTAGQGAATDADFETKPIDDQSELGSEQIRQRIDALKTLFSLEKQKLETAIEQGGNLGSLKVLFDHFEQTLNNVNPAETGEEALGLLQNELDALLERMRELLPSEAVEGSAGEKQESGAVPIEVAPPAEPGPVEEPAVPSEATSAETAAPPESEPAPQPALVAPPEPVATSADAMAETETAREKLQAEKFLALQGKILDLQREFDSALRAAEASSFDGEKGVEKSVLLSRTRRECEDDLDWLREEAQKMRPRMFKGEEYLPDDNALERKIDYMRKRIVQIKSLGAASTEPAMTAAPELAEAGAGSEPLAAHPSGEVPEGITAEHAEDQKRNGEIRHKFIGDYAQLLTYLKSVLILTKNQPDIYSEVVGIETELKTDQDRLTDAEINMDDNDLRQFEDRYLQYAIKIREIVQRINAATKASQPAVETVIGPEPSPVPPSVEAETDKNAVGDTPPLAPGPVETPPQEAAESGVEPASPVPTAEIVAGQPVLTGEVRDKSELEAQLIDKKKRLDDARRELVLAELKSKLDAHTEALYENARIDYVENKVSLMMEERVALVKARIAEKKNQAGLFAKAYKWLGDANLSKYGANLLYKKFLGRENIVPIKDIDTKPTKAFKVVANIGINLLPNILSIRTGISLGLAGLGAGLIATGNVPLGFAALAGRRAMLGLGAGIATEHWTKIGLEWSSKTFGKRRQHTDDEVNKMSESQIVDALAEFEAAAEGNREQLEDNQTYGLLAEKFEQISKTAEQQKIVGRLMENSDYELEKVRKGRKFRDKTIKYVSYAVGVAAGGAFLAHDYLKPPGVAAGAQQAAGGDKAPRASSNLGENQSGRGGGVPRSESARAELAAKTQAGGAVEQVDYQGGNSVWNEVGRQLEKRMPGKFDMSDESLKPERIYLVDSFKDKVVENPSEYGLPADADFTKMSEEQLRALDWDKLFENKEELKLPDLTEVQKENILNYQGEPGVETGADVQPPPVSAALGEQTPVGAEAAVSQPAEVGTNLTPDQVTAKLLNEATERSVGLRDKLLASNTDSDLDVFSNYVHKTMAEAATDPASREYLADYPQERLAFILGHDIAPELNRDDGSFWNYGDPNFVANRIQLGDYYLVGMSENFVGDKVPADVQAGSFLSGKGDVIHFTREEGGWKFSNWQEADNDWHEIAKSPGQGKFSTKEAVDFFGLDKEKPALFVSAIYKEGAFVYSFSADQLTEKFPQIGPDDASRLRDFSVDYWDRGVVPAKIQGWASLDTAARAAAVSGASEPEKLSYLRFQIKDALDKYAQNPSQENLGFLRGRVVPDAILARFENQTGANEFIELLNKAFVDETRAKQLEAIRHLVETK